MLSLPNSIQVYLASEPVDLRRGHDGLVALVRNHLHLDPFAGHLFVFLGKGRDRVKILFWDNNGFVVYYKRLSQGRFPPPPIPPGSQRVSLDSAMLAMLLAGIDLRRFRRPPAWQPASLCASP